MMRAEYNDNHARCVVIDVGLAERPRTVHVSPLRSARVDAGRWVARIEVIRRSGEHGRGFCGSANLTRAQTLATVRALLSAADIAVAELEQGAEEDTRVDVAPPRVASRDVAPRIPGVPMGAKRVTP